MEDNPEVSRAATRRKSKRRERLSVIQRTTIDSLLRRMQRRGRKSSPRIATDEQLRNEHSDLYMDTAGYATILVISERREGAYMISRLSFWSYHLEVNQFSKMLHIFAYEKTMFCSEYLCVIL